MNIRVRHAIPPGFNRTATTHSRMCPENRRCAASNCGMERSRSCRELPALGDGGGISGDAEVASSLGDVWAALHGALQDITVRARASSGDDEPPSAEASA